MKWLLMLCVPAAVLVGCDGTGQGLSPMHSVLVSHASDASQTYRPPLPNSPYLRGPGERELAVAETEPRFLEESLPAESAKTTVLQRRTLVNNRPPEVNLSVASRQ